MSEAATEFKPNLERLKKLEQQASSIRIGGKVNYIFYLDLFFNEILKQIN